MRTAHQCHRPSVHFCICLGNCILHVPLLRVANAPAGATLLRPTHAILGVTPTYHTRSSLRNMYRVGHRRSTSSVVFCDWQVLGVYIVHVRLPPVAAGPHAQRWTMVVFLHRDVRFIPSILHRRFLVAPGELRRRIVRQIQVRAALVRPVLCYGILTPDSYQTTTPIRCHHPDRPLRHIQAVPERIRQRSVPRLAAPLPARLPV